MKPLLPTLIRVLPILAIGALIGPVPLTAQAPGTAPSSPERLRELFAQLSPRDDLQLTTPVLFIERATFESVSPRSVLVLADGQQTSVNLEEIRAVSVRSAHALQGSIWGLGAGLLVGSVGGLLVGSFGCVTQDECISGERDGAIWGAVVLGGLSAAGGFLLGRRDTYWKPIFP